MRGKTGGARVSSLNKDDLIRTVLLVCSLLLLNRVDISYLYHYIRGQMSSYIKLYVIYNVLEVFDKLCCSLGQDILNSMSSWGAPPGTNAQPWYWSCLAALVATAYTTMHSYILLVQVVTLNVAINSQNNSLITLLVANNFTELKGHVFKKFDEGTLLQVLCADMVERFQMFVFLLLVTIQNWAKDGRVSNQAWIQEWGPMVMFVFASELGVDWIKHAFVTKFNKIEPEVYNRYRDVIWEHVCNAWRLREPHRVAKHIGFVSLPLSVVFLRVCYHTLSPAELERISHNWLVLLPLAVVWWLVCSGCKIQLYLLLLGIACTKHSKMVRAKSDLSHRSSGSGNGKARSGQGDGKASVEASFAGSVAAQEAAVVAQLMGVEMFTRTSGRAAATVGDVQNGAALPSALNETSGSGITAAQDPEIVLGVHNIYRTSSAEI